MNNMNDIQINASFQSLLSQLNTAAGTIAANAGQIAVLQAQLKEANDALLDKVLIED